MAVDRSHWLNHVRDVVRSRHYTWLPEGLGGEQVDEAMTYLLADIMHVCKLTHTPFDEVLQRARTKFEAEEASGLLGDNQSTEPAASPPSQPVIDGDEIVVVYTSNDAYDAEIIRGVLQSEGIACRVDSSSQGGFTELVEVKVLAHARDADRAEAAIHHKSASFKRTPPTDSH